MTLQLVAAIPIGFEQVVAREIRALGGGIGKTSSRAGRIFFEGPADAIYRANLRLRTAERVLVQVGEFSARSMLRWGVYAAEIPWEDWIPSGSEVGIHLSTRACRLFHSGALHDQLMEAIAKRGVTGCSPAGKESAGGSPRLAVDVRGTADRFVLSVDTSGAGLHRRGYRKETTKAPLRETIAAALLQRIDWSPAQPLLDPMCGSGTFVIEAGWLAQRRDPGLERSFAFEQFPCFDGPRWSELLEQSRSKMVADAGGVQFEAADRQSGAVRATRNNLQRAGMPRQVRVDQRAFEELRPDGGRGLIVLNPPYGHRLREDAGEGHRRQEDGGSDAVMDTWSSWGATVRDRRPGWDVLLLAPSREHASAFGASGKPRARFRNGGLPISAWHLRGGR